jgi:competence protein ComEC
MRLSPRRGAETPARGSSSSRHPRRAPTRALVVTSAAAVVALGMLGLIVHGGPEQSAPRPWTWRAGARWQQATWPREPWLVVTFLDVGQGDATVVRLPSGRTWLVDAGGSTSDRFDLGERVTATALWALGHRRLSRVVVTHGHPDHAGGVPSVLRRLGARELLTGVPVPGDPLSEAMDDAAQRAGTVSRRVLARESYADDLVRVQVVHPPEPDWERRQVRNDDSVVLWIRFGDVGLLLPGDVGQQVEGAWAARVAAAPLTILKLAHHGSATSSGASLLQALAPSLAIASAGRGNRFGHPAAPVVQRLARTGVTLLRTDQDGAIQVATNGRVLLVRTASGLEGSLTSRGPRRAWWLARPLPSDPATRHASRGPRWRDALPSP